MPTYPAESFYRWTIRQSISNTLTVPFNLKVSKMPALSAGLMTISPNTANEEICEYSGKDPIAMTITIIKRAINPSTQTLATAWVDYNNVTFQFSHSQNDTIRWDVTHLHIIQDNANKLDKAGWLRDSMGNSRQVTEIDVTGNEVKKAIVDWVSIWPTETIRKRKSDWTYEEIPYSFVTSDVATIAWWAITVTPYESTITVWQPVWIVYDGSVWCTTEIKTSANVSASAVTQLWMAHLDSTRIFFMYSSWANVYARVWTLTNDVMTYWAEVTVAALGTWPCTWGCALIWTDKVAMAYVDATVTSQNRQKIATISWTTITLWTEVQQAVGTAWFGMPITSVCKVRDDVYAVWARVYNGTYVTTYIFISTVSGTTITLNAASYVAPANNYILGSLIYLSDNLLWKTEYMAGSNRWDILAINPAWVNITTTYTWTITSWQASQWVRISDTEYVAVHNIGWGSPTVYYTRISKPPSGTANIVTTILNTAQTVEFPIINMGWGYFAILNTTTTKLQVYWINGNLVWEISAYSTPILLVNRYMNMVNGRFVYLNGANWTSNIINFWRIFYVGVAHDTSGWVTFRSIMTITWIVRGQKYYVQDDWTLWNRFTSRYIGDWLATDTLRIW